MEIVRLEPTEKVIAAARLLSEYSALWDSHFPGFHRRSYWNIIGLLMTEGCPNGVSVRTVHGHLNNE
jgi:hypothetical protein